MRSGPALRFLFIIQTPRSTEQLTYKNKEALFTMFSLRKLVKKEKHFLGYVSNGEFWDKADLGRVRDWKVSERKAAVTRVDEVSVAGKHEIGRIDEFQWKIWRPDFFFYFITFVCLAPGCIWSCKVELFHKNMHHDLPWPSVRDENILVHI